MNILTNDYSVILQNLSRVSIKRIYGVANNTDKGWAFGILRMKDVTTGFYWSSHILVNQVENHLLRNNVHTKNIDALNIRIYNGDLGLESNIFHTVDYCDYFYIS